MYKTKYYCDRCGEEKNKDFVINVVVGERVVRDVGWVSLSSRSGYKKDLDLCEKCLIEFVDWFENNN